MHHDHYDNDRIFKLIAMIRIVIMMIRIMTMTTIMNGAPILRIARRDCKPRPLTIAPLAPAGNNSDRWFDVDKTKTLHINIKYKTLKQQRYIKRDVATSKDG